MAQERDEGIDDVWADLVIALLAVNNYSLEKVFTHAAAFRALGLFDPSNLAGWGSSEIAQRLGKAGYGRGPVMTQIFSERLSALGRFTVERGRAECETVLHAGSVQAVIELLTSVKGIGPTVVRNYLVLRGDAS